MYLKFALTKRYIKKNVQNVCKNISDNCKQNLCKKSDYTRTNEISDAFFFKLTSITLSMKIDVYISEFKFKDKEIFNIEIIMGLERIVE